jgi:alkylhydroperoxidase/carboxymuconolactone decarboxylase family protein YurZ
MKKLAVSLVMSSLAASAAEAQERPTGRIAPPEVYAVAPALGDHTDDLLFGDVWRREELAPRDRSIVTVSALIASGRTAQVGGHVGRALDNGVMPREIGEIITHLAFYSGWPNAISAVVATKEVFDKRGIGEVTADAGEPVHCHVTDPEADQVTATELAVDGEVEHREVARCMGQLQPYADAPDMLRFQRGLRPDQASLVPRSPAPLGILAHQGFLVGT